jgi:crotonobetainyl-CoA:carnitine CoA-transferase CaiB-like acyl-CoA transferase
MDFSLKGIMVIQTASAAAGPMAGRLLADWGADVIRVDHTIRRTQMAQKRAIQQNTDRRTIVSNVNYAEENHNCNKRSITLNLSMDSGREIIYKLLEKADVLISNFRPYELEKFKLDYGTLSQLNPRIICANITGFGTKGPDRDAPAYGPMGDARSGLAHVLQAPGMEPVQMPSSFADYLTGLSLVSGIGIALFLREQTGVGQQVDASLFKTMAWAISNDIAGSLITKQDRQAVYRKERGNATTNTYRTKGGRWLALQLSERNWPAFCQAIGKAELEHDPRFELPVSRADNYLALLNILEEVFLTKTLDEWKPYLTEAGIIWSPLQSLPEVINDPQARANDFFAPFDHPSYGHMELMTGPVTLSKTPVSIRMPRSESGEHTEEVLLKIGYTHDDIAKFREQGVIL